MRKAIKRIAMLFMVCGLAVSVSSAYELTEMQKSNNMSKKLWQSWRE